MDVDLQNPKNRLNQLLRRKQEIDFALQNRKKDQIGALDFVGYKLNKERQKIKEDLARLNIRFTPDTIA